MGVYIKGITVEMFRNAPLESIEELLSAGDFVDIKEPHGRLIDADALVNTVVFHTNIPADTKEFIEDLIGIAPTVIEAEVKDEADEPVR